jgi:hypothetical protein
MSKDNPSSRNNSRRLIPIPGSSKLLPGKQCDFGEQFLIIMVNPVQGLIPIKGFSLY